ncbi:molybdopterin molybdotransferase MoeA [Teichococcus vastitatis]|uniref:Molybdopterin molybdenumtransferase n=1 Tax=Teichococcus vastitatis TaxID=2307076 RepID=A0ABS9WCS8_9PROT|nr:gephyrin-like molybdotransferase Glp [Pseudoroseomonas vastitatis]MCI0757007.1 molybdopterin molybdotransferase MoeA [Pseudoroseomonas vastitatis]
MAGLSADCFAHGGASLDVAAAAALVVAGVPIPTRRELVPLQAARGRVLAAPLRAPHALPPFSNSAVDGFAFRHAALSPRGATVLPLAGRLAAGTAPGAPLGPGEACRILTGAPLPPGADTVVMQEDARVEGAALRLPEGLALVLPPGANCRMAGEDMAADAEALAEGTRLGPAEIALAAALGQVELAVRPRPRIGVFSTGNELVAPGGRLGPAQTFDSNRFALLALLAGLPVEPVDLGILPDNAEATAGALRHAAAAHDLLLTSGGISGGEEDHVRGAIARCGTLRFWRLAVKPGRPAAMGVVDGTPVLGLPGNPVAAMVAFLHLARPLAMRLCGARPEVLPRFAARAGFDHRKKPGRREYLRVSLEAAPGGLPVARLFPRQGSASLTSLTGSDAFAELPEDGTGVVAGEMVAVLPFAGLL